MISLLWATTAEDHRSGDRRRRRATDLINVGHTRTHTAQSTGAHHKIYIHEFIDIIGHNRANYMHHMTANFSPMAQRDRDQLCYGVWGRWVRPGVGPKW